MAKIISNDRIFHAKPLWNEYLQNTDFTSDKNPYLHKYFIDAAKVTKEDFEREYQTASSNPLS